MREPADRQRDVNETERRDHGEAQACIVELGQHACDQHGDDRDRRREIRMLLELSEKSRDAVHWMRLYPTGLITACGPSAAKPASAGRADRRMPCGCRPGRSGWRP